MSLYQEPLTWDPAVIERYDLTGPRYTSYPTAPQFREMTSSREWRSAVRRSNDSGRPLSLYFHIPFCDTLCFYCACNKIVTHNTQRNLPYLQRVEREMALQASEFDTSRPVEQLHWGGGTPTFISEEEMTLLMDATRRHFRLLDNDKGEYSVEVHPGRVGAEKLAHMRELGFNRVSMGIQDFHPRVQEAVNRYNSETQVSKLVEAVRAQGYQSVSMDLIYGLPLQTPVTFRDTLERVIGLGPDRLSLFSYAHLPHLFKSQRLIHESELPSPENKLAILQEAIERLQAAGYVYIGMDHFAKPDDSLVVAQQEGRLQRNFQGYSTHGDCDLIAFGVSSISHYGDTYFQNAKQIDGYQELIDQGRTAIVKGVHLSREDLLRRAVISELICHFRLNFEALRERFDIEPERYFAAELNDLRPMVEDGLLSIAPDGIQVHNRGRLLIRNVCMVFDQYLQADNAIRYSKVI